MLRLTKLFKGDTTYLNENDLGRRRKRSIATVTSVLCAILFSLCYFVKEIGYHYYLAKDLSVEQAISRYGKPLWTHHGSKNTDEIHLYYYTGFLNVAELKCSESRVIDVDLYPVD